MSKEPPKTPSPQENKQKAPKRLVLVQKPSEAVLEQFVKWASIGQSIRGIAATMGISENLLRLRIKEYPEIQDAINQGYAIAENEVVATAKQLATDGKHENSTWRWLKLRDPNRWSEAQHEAEAQAMAQLPNAKEALEALQAIDVTPEPLPPADKD